MNTTETSYEQIAGIIASARPPTYTGDTPVTEAERGWLRIMSDLAFLFWAKDENFDLDVFKDGCYS